MNDILYYVVSLVVYLVKLRRHNWNHEVVTQGKIVQRVECVEPHTIHILLTKIAQRPL